MEFNIKLERPFLYNETILTILYIILFSTLFILISLFLYKKYKKQIKRLFFKVSAVSIKNYYLRKLAELNHNYRSGKINNRKTCELLSSLVRHFVNAKTDISVQTFSLDEIKKLNMPNLYRLIERLYNPEFSKYSDDDIINLIDEARGIITNWNY